MPDITMCKDSECPQAETCYRFTAKPLGDWQSYFAESPRVGRFIDVGIGCGYYWPVRQGGTE